MIVIVLTMFRILSTQNKEIAQTKEAISSSFQNYLKICNNSVCICAVHEHTIKTIYSLAYEQQSRCE